MCMEKKLYLQQKQILKLVYENRETSYSELLQKIYKWPVDYLPRDQRINTNQQVYSRQKKGKEYSCVHASLSRSVNSRRSVL